MGLHDLPLAHCHDIVKAFERRGWKPRAISNHVVLTKPGHNPLSVPNHREVKRALLAKLIKSAGMTTEDFLQAFHD